MGAAHKLLHAHTHSSSSASDSRSVIGASGAVGYTTPVFISKQSTAKYGRIGLSVQKLTHPKSHSAVNQTHTPEDGTHPGTHTTETDVARTCCRVSFFLCFVNFVVVAVVAHPKFSLFVAFFRALRFFLFGVSAFCHFAAFRSRTICV